MKKILCLSLAVVLLAQVCMVPALSAGDDGLVAYWDFGEGDCDLVYDITGNGFTGVIESTDYEWVAGYRDTAVLFNTVESKIKIQNHTALNAALLGASQITVTGMIKKNDGVTAVNTDKFFRIVTDKAVLEFNLAAKMFCGARSESADGYQNKSDGYKYEANPNWHHFAYVVDYANNLITLYVDGVVSESWTAAFGSDTYQNTGVTLIQIGNYTVTLDDLKIFNKGLTVGEIKSDVPPAAHWTLDGIKDGVISDECGYNQEMSLNTSDYDTAYGYTDKVISITDADNAKKFQAVNQGVLGNALVGAGGLTLSFWLKIKDGVTIGSITASDLFALKNTNNASFLDAKIAANGNITVGARSAVADGYISTYGVNIEDHDWRKITAVVDYAAKEIRIYYNTTLVRTLSSAAFANTKYAGGGAGANSLYFGNRQVLMDDIKLERKALSTQEVIDAYNAQAFSQHYYYLKSDNSELFTADNGTIKINTRLFNNKAAPANAVVITGLYVDGENEMRDAVISIESDIAPYTVRNVPDDEIIVPGDGKDYVLKTFVWDSLSGLRPFSAVQVLPSGN